jgi:signal transduction histidine kinase/ABC-type sugar transport system substrate-binding protein/AraC-like DNA-binding protein
MTDSVRVGFALRPGEPFWVQVREAVQQRAQDLGVTLAPLTWPESFPDESIMLSIFEDLKARELGAVITQALPPAFMRSILNEGLPLICAEDTALTHPLLISVHGLAEAAIMAANYLAERMNGRGHILMVGGSIDDSLTAVLRVRGFHQVLERYPGMRCTHAGQRWSAEETLESLLETDTQWTAAFGGGPIDAIFGLSDPLALAGWEAAKTLGMIHDKTLVVGINGDPLALAAIQAGVMHATIETSPEQLGARLAEYARLAALREPAPQHFPYAFELVTAENLAQVAMRKLLAIAQIPSRLVNVNFRQEQQRLTQMQTSLELNQRVGSILDQDELRAEMAEIIRARYEYEDVQFFLWSQSDRAFVHVQEKRRADEDQLIIPLAQSAALGYALLHNQPVYIPDVPNGKRFAPDPRWPDIQSRVILPVHVGGRIVGLLDLHSHRRTLRNQAELDALQILADELGIAMRNAQLYAQAIGARAEAVQAGLLRSRLFAHVSHQLRTPLNVILGYCQSAMTMARADDALPARALLDDLHYIEYSGFDLQRLIDDLLDLAQAEAGMLQLHRQVCDPKQLLEDIFMTAMRVWADDHAVRWRLQLPAQLPQIFVDPMRLRNVLMNLLDNAARHTDQGQIVLGAEQVEGELHTWVEDTGCGMSAAALVRIRRYMLMGVGGASPRSAEAEHVGVGLSMSHHLVMLHGGELQIESSEGRGTTCHLFLPLAADPVDSLAGADRIAIYGPRSTLPDQAAAQLCKKVRDYVAVHFATILTREQIAAALGVSPSYVSRVFRRCTGMALWDYVNGFRVARARDLLEHSDMTVTEVAFAVGYNDPAYFSRIFSKTTGKSPRDFRSHT